MARRSLDQLLELTTDERLDIVQAIWDSLARNPEAVPVTQAQRDELDRRLKAYEQDGDAGESWNSAKRSLRDE